MDSDVGETFNFVFPWVASAPVLLALALGFIAYFTYFRRKEDSSNDKAENNVKMPPQEETMCKVEPISSTKASKKKQQSEKWSKHTFSHDWILTSLKGHSGPVLDMDFSANNKFLVTGAEDRAIFIWNTKDWKEREHKYLRYNVDLDHASLLKWSPDSKAFIYKRNSDNVLEVCKVIRQDGRITGVVKSHTYDKLHEEDTIGMGIDSKGRYLMSCSSGTEIVLIDLKGNELARFDTYLMNNYAAKLSPCGKYVAASGFVADVKVWEVRFTFSGEFKQVIKAFDLVGHSSGVFDFAFNADSTRIATISKDGTWKLFDININYKDEDPHVLQTGKYKADGNSKVCLALSPDSHVLALACGSTLYFINTINGTVHKKITDIFPGNITKLLFESAGQYLLAAGQKHVRVFKNVTGYVTTAMDARSKLASPTISTATRERLEATVAAQEELLRPFLGT